MKKILRLSGIFLLFGISFLVISCGQGFPPASFSVNLPTISTVFPPSPVGEISISKTTTSAERDSLLAAQGGPGYKIVSTEIESQKFTCSGKNKNFNSFEYFETWIAAPGLPDLKIAEKNPVPLDVTSVSLDTLHQELKDYFIGDQYTVTMKVKLKTALTDSLSTKLNAKFHFLVEY